MCSWHLWVFVVLFLLIDINGWHTYFYLSFLPLIVSVHWRYQTHQIKPHWFNFDIFVLTLQLLLIVGAKLEHVITQLAQDSSIDPEEQQSPVRIKPSDQHFWCHRPRIVLYLIHFILFQNSFEIAFFIWILVSKHTVYFHIYYRVGYL